VSGEHTIAAPGACDAQIIAVKVETDPFDSDGLVLVFELAAPNGAVVKAKHSTTGKYADKTRAVVEEALGLDWPYGIEVVEQVVGRTVPIFVVHKDDHGRPYARAYINTQKRGEPADAATVKRNLDKLAGKSDPSADDVPF
jgi:hypothetical protein